MSIRVTITKPNVTDAYGLPMVVGSTYTVNDDFGLSLISQGMASDTDSSLTNPGVREADALGVVYCNAATLAAPTAQMLASYNTVFALDVAPFTRYRSNGTYLVPEGQYSTDASGNITGLAGRSNSVIPIGDRFGPPTLIKQFSDLVGVTIGTSNATVVSSIDLASPFGVPALKLVITFSTTGGRVEVTPASQNVQNFAGHVGYTVWVDDAQRIGQASVFIGTSGFAAFQRANTLLFAGGQLGAGPQVFYGGPLRTLNTTDGGFVFGSSSLIDTKLRISAPNPLNNTATVWVRDCFISNPQRPVVVFTHDDGWNVWAATAGPALVNAGFRGTFGINSAQIGGGATQISNSSIQSLIAAGHQLSSHCVNNYKLQTLFGQGDGQNDGTGTSTPPTSYLADYYTGRAALLALGADPQDFMYHPWVQGGFDQWSQELLFNAGCDLARGVYNEMQVYGFPLWNNARALCTIALDNTITLAQAKAKVDDAITYGAACIFMIHDLQAAAGSLIWAIQDYLDLVTYVASKGSSVDVLTMRKFRDRLASLGLLRPRDHYETTAPVRLVGRLVGANFNSTADQAITLDAGTWQITEVYVTKPSVSLTTAAGGLYTGAAKGGTAIVAAAQTYTGLTAATDVVALTMAATPTISNNTMYLSLTTGQGAAATASVFVYGRPA